MLNALQMHRLRELGREMYAAKKAVSGHGKDFAIVVEQSLTEPTVAVYKIIEEDSRECIAWSHSVHSLIKSVRSILLTGPGGSDVR